MIRLLRYLHILHDWTSWIEGEGSYMGLPVKTYRKCKKCNYIFIISVQ